MSRILTEPRVDVDETTEISDDEDHASGWFCISTNPYPCPASGCPFVADRPDGYAPRGRL